MDALLATVQMPTGIPVATVAIDGANNAALLAVAILAIGDAELTEKLAQYRRDLAAKTLAG
jgi:5-(carboxyamino)imidazole ribonucleotide mutase